MNLLEINLPHDEFTSDNIFAVIITLVIYFISISLCCSSSSSSAHQRTWLRPIVSLHVLLLFFCGELFLIYIFKCEITKHRNHCALVNTCSLPILDTHIHILPLLLNVFISLSLLVFSFLCIYVYLCISRCILIFTQTRTSAVYVCGGGENPQGQEKWREDYLYHNWNIKIRNLENRRVCEWLHFSRQKYHCWI